MADLSTAISMADAIRIALEHAHALEPIEVPVEEGLGHVLASDVLAAEPHPPFRASIKDGYAVRAGDVVQAGARLEVVGESRAGARTIRAVGPGQACYITTGGPVPDGADAVVEVERTSGGGKGGAGRRSIVVLRSPKVGQDIRPVGFDIPVGSVVLAAGELIGAPEIGILATVGAPSVRVHRKPKLCILSTGDEVTAAGAAQGLAPNCIRDAVRPMLLAAAREERLARECVDLGVCADSAAELRAAIERALGCGADALVTSGAVSAGDRDLLGAHVLAEYGEVLYSLVKMKPGKPLTLTAARRPGGGRPLLIFSLPGNPVSAYATFQLVVAPALRKLGGARQPRGRTLPVELAQSLALDPDRPEYHRATLAAGRSGTGSLPRAHSTGGQISSRLLSCRQADVLLELPQGPGVLAAGTRVDAIVLRDLRSHVARPAALVEATAAPGGAPRRRVRVHVLPLPATRLAADGRLLEACADAAGAALRAAGFEPEPCVRGADARVANLFRQGEQALVILLARPGSLPLGHALLDEARAQLGERLQLVLALAAAVRRAASRAAPTTVAAQDAALVDGCSVLLVLDGVEETVTQCVRAVAGPLAELSVPNVTAGA